jgi:hypothetical protein
MVAMTPSDAMPRQATGILAQFPGPVILHQTRLLWIVLLALPWGPIVYLVWRFWPFLTNLTIKGMLVAFVPLGLVWGLSTIVAVMCITRGLPRLVLDGEGFELQHLLGSYFRKRWRDLAGFSPCLFFVLFRYQAPAPSLWAKFNRECFLPAYFGFGTKGLAAVMTVWRERALAQPWGR